MTGGIEGNQVSSHGDIWAAGEVGAGGRLISHSGRAISVSGQDPVFSCWNTTANQAVGILVGNEGTFSIAQLDANGTWINHRMTIDQGGNVSSGGWHRVGGGGIHYQWSANVIGFGWATQAGDHVSVIVDNGGAHYPLANAWSDARAKQDIAPSTFDCLEAVRGIPLFEYRWRKHDPQRAGLMRAADPNDRVVPVGFVAQELHKVFPHVVLPGDTNEEGALGKIWSLDHSTILATLVGALQQLTARVEELEAAQR